MDPYFFGYGSLVNCATHAHDDARPALLKGWRRAWRHTALRPVAFLTAVPDPGCAIDGLVARVPGGDWIALDDREHAYDRVVATDVSHEFGLDAEIHLYTIPEGKHRAPDRLHPIILSYIDVVVEGYHRTFGDAGVERFFATTSGWDAPVADDRAHPLYSRHRSVDQDIRATVDRWLDDAGARRVYPPTPEALRRA